MKARGDIYSLKEIDNGWGEREGERERIRRRKGRRNSQLEFYMKNDICPHVLLDPCSPSYPVSKRGS